MENTIAVRRVLTADELKTTKATQLDAVHSVMADGQYRTLGQLAEDVTAAIGRKATEASVSARLRDLRKDKFGGLQVERQSCGDGLYQYRVVVK